MATTKKRAKRQFPVTAEYNPTMHMKLKEAAKMMGYTPDHFNHAIARKIGLRKYRDDTQGIFFQKADIDTQMANGAGVGRRLVNPVRKITPAVTKGNNGTVPTNAGIVTVVGTVDLIQTLLQAGVGIRLEVPPK